MVWTLKTKLLAGALGASLALGSGWAYVAAAERRARELAVAEEQERTKNVLKEADEKRERERVIEREQAAKLIQANVDMAQRLQAVSAARDAEAAKNRAAALAPKTVEQAVKDAIEQLHITPHAEPDGRVSITQQELQAFSAMKIDLDRLVAKDAEREQQMRLIEDTNKRLLSESAEYAASLKEKDALIASQEQVIASYKKIAKRGRWAKIGGAAGRIGLAVLPAVAAAVVLR